MWLSALFFSRSIRCYTKLPLGFPTVSFPLKQHKIESTSASKIQTIQVALYTSSLLDLHKTLDALVCKRHLYMRRYKHDMESIFPKKKRMPALTLGSSAMMGLQSKKSWYWLYFFQYMMTFLLPWNISNIKIVYMLPWHILSFFLFNNK